jgi:hypothetical protein
MCKIHWSSLKEMQFFKVPKPEIETAEKDTPLFCSYLLILLYAN